MTSMLRLDRTRATLTTLDAEHDDEFMPGTPAERIEAVWDITVALWSMKTQGAIHAGTRMQKDVAQLRHLNRLPEA